MKKKNKLNSFAKRGLINVSFVPSQNTIIFLPFFPPSSPLFLSLSFLLGNCERCFPFIVLAEHWVCSP